MTTPAISVIVAVYNARQYLNRCADSILAQDFEDFEVLLIDDGSTDGSGEMCDEYAKKDKRVRVFHKENGGVSSARQLGIEEAKGEYSIHADSDDWIESNMLSGMYDEISRNGSDILIVDFYTNTSSNKQRLNKQEPTGYTADALLSDMLSGKIMGSLWNKLIRHGLYKTHNITFPAGINYCEDQIVAAELFLKTSKISYLPRAYYHYMDNPGSITRKPTKKAFGWRMAYIQYMEDMLDREKLQGLTETLELRKVMAKYEMLTSGTYTKREFRNIPLKTTEDYGSLPMPMRHKVFLYLDKWGFYYTSSFMSRFFRNLSKRVKK